MAARHAAVARQSGRGGSQFNECGALGGRAQSAAGSLVRPDNQVAYVSCHESKKVAAINLQTWNVDQLIDAGAACDGLAWANGQ